MIVKSSALAAFGSGKIALIVAGLLASILLSACGGGGGGGDVGNVGGGNNNVGGGNNNVGGGNNNVGGGNNNVGGGNNNVGGGDTPPPASVGSDDKDNKPPPPEIMKADSDSPLSPQEPVLAATESGASESGAALLTVTVSNGGELLPFTDANGFSSEGGSVAVISLSRAAAALFTADGLVMSLVLTATNAGGTVLSTVSFASSALGIDGAGLTLHLTTALLRSETELFAATDASLTIWHNGDKEEKYELLGLGWDLFTVGADGGVRVADDLPVSGEGAFYGLTLRLTDGAVDAERSLSLRLTPPQTETTPPRTEAPPPPEIEGELLGETKLVDALSGSGTALLAVTVSNGGELLSFANANGFASGGGAVAVISLARPATALFTLDNLTLSLAITATNAGGTVSETVSFASSARGFDGLGLSLHLTTALLRPETELFAAADSRLTIWHNDGKEESYELSGLDSQLFAADADGGVRVASDLPVSGEGAFYELTLRLTDEAAIAERLLFLRLTPPPPEIEGELLGETKLVNALSGSGTALLTVTVSNGGALLSFADANGFASDGGAVAVISLSRSATALFTLDGLTLSLALTATNAGGTVSATVSFASSARGFDGLGLSLHLTTALLRPETELFAATDSRLTIWHNDGKKESYELSGLDSQLFAAGADGGVRVASDLPVSGEGAFYELTLRLTDGAAIAERLLFLRLTPPPPEIEGELLGETKLVNALSGSGTALLAVTVSNGGALSPFTDANGFASDGGAVAVISLSRSATALFTLDGLALSLALTATNAGGTVSETVSFASSALGIDGLELSLHLTTALLRSETELFAAADSRLTIWHNDGKEESYELSGLDSQLFAAGADGGVRVASDLPVSGDGALYELTLRLTDGAAIAERLLFLRLTPPLPEIEGVSGETKLVNALSGSGTALLAVTVSNGGALSPFTDANGFASDGGAVAVISLARSATALFTLDGLTLSLALTATNAGGTVSATVSFASSARGFDGLGLTLHLTTALLGSGTELFAATDSRLTIWHNDGKEENYKLSGLDSQLFVADAGGGVRVASDLPVSGEGAFYELTLRLTDGAAIAERLLFLRLTPPLPQIEGELLGETKLVDALSGSGTALLTVTVSNGGVLSPIADANGFASGGGAVAVISLARSATALFTLDGLTLSLALTATNAGGTVSETVSFASSARGFDGLGLSLHLTTALLRPETELFAAADARLTIWHNDGKEESYELSGLDSQLFAADADGGVRVASDLPVSGEGAFYELTLRLTDGAAIAERLLFLRLTPPLPEIEGVSGETKLVDALSGSGTALLAVTVSNGGALSPFSDANGFASEGGAVAVISLARSATALFTLDGLALSLALTATNAGGTVSETVSFVSSALGIDGAGLFASFATVMLPSETEVFAAADARLTIWHNDGKQETYGLSGTDASLFAVDVNGGVRTASDLSSSEDNLLYELTLRLTDGSAIAERLLTLALLPPPIAVDVEVECAGQWPCRDQFAAALSAAIESGEATLDHGQAVVIDLEGGTHGSEVHSVFQLYGIGASVSLTLAEDEDLPRGGFILHTPDAFLELPAKKKQIVAHSVADLIAPAETLEEKDAIVAQAAANLYHPFPSFYRTTRRPDAPALITAAVETGLMVVVGGIAKTSERYELNSGYTEIDFDKRYTYKDYCDGTRKHKGTGGPPNVITLNGEEYCSVFDRCGWMQNYCLVAPAIDVVIDAETGQREEGTSYAAPQAAAALQMLSTMWPELSQRELALMLLELADDVGEQDHEGRDLGGIDHVYGHGVLSFRRLYAPGGLSPFIVGDEIFRFSCDADSNTCQKSPIENVDSENEENKQPPEIIKADSDSPLSPQKPVLAAAESGTALLTVTVSNGELSPFADTNGFASEGGAVAVISLARSAAALFTLDGLTLSLALTATNAGGTVSATVSFASSALGIDGAGLFASFATVILPSETEVFAAADARLTIWHNGDKQETYELSGTDASLFAVDVNGGVRAASDLSSSEDDLLYELTLRLTDGAAIAERLLTLALLPPPIAVVYPIIYPAVAVSLPAGTFSAPKRFLSESTEVFPSEKVRMTIAHNANKSALYTLEGEYSELFVVAENDGGVRTFRDESLGESLNYELTLRLMNGESVVAERLLFLRLTLHAIEPRSALPLQDVGCTGQWPCRDQFAEALAAATESGEATLDHERLLVLDVSTSKGDHGAHVYSVVERFGSGARVRLWTEWNFLSVVTKKKQIVNHSVAGELIASAGTLEEKDVIVTQAAGNDWSLNPSFPGFFDNPSDVTAAVETGLMIVVGGIGKVSERYYPTKKQRLRYEYVPESSWPSVPVYAPIDLDDPSTFTDYCDGRNRFRDGISTGGLGPDVFTKDGEGWCSVYDRCGWMQNYCLVAPAMRVPTYAQGSRSTESNGTSVSAPQIAAALQMLGDMWPELSQYDLAQMALLLADDIGDIGIDEVYGHGALSFRQLYVPGGLSFATEDGIFRFSCDADANTCQKGRP